VGDEVRVQVDRDADIVAARQKGREIALQVGLTGSDLTLVATAISEVARNIISYAAHGEIVLQAVQKEGRSGISVIARDQGPGIADVAQAMQDGFSTGKSLGLGLPGAQRLMDEFEIQSVVGEGTTVAMWKWAR
jgi:serine/threonine-protein kinase RsbT